MDSKPRIIKGITWTAKDEHSPIVQAYQIIDENNQIIAHGVSTEWAARIVNVPENDAFIELLTKERNELKQQLNEEDETSDLLSKRIDDLNINESELKSITSELLEALESSRQTLAIALESAYTTGGFKNPSEMVNEHITIKKIDQAIAKCEKGE